MQVLIVGVPGAYQPQPRAVVPFTLAQITLHRRIDEDAAYPGIIRRQANQLCMLVGPALIQALGMGVNQDRLLQPFSLAALQQRQIETKPDIHVEPGLVTDMPVRHRATKRDRKSTRLNSSHVRISYAVFCLKKKNTKW